MNSNFVLQTAHPLIKSEQTYVLDRKLVSIHSGDRDFNKWPNSNEFGVDLGVNFNNVQSMRLINFAIPVNHYTFSDYYQNTKLSFTYTTNFPIILRDFSNNVTGPISPQYSIIKRIFLALFDVGDVPKDIGIQWLKYAPPNSTQEWVNLFPNATSSSWTNTGDPFDGSVPDSNLFPTTNDISGSSGLMTFGAPDDTHGDPAVVYFRLLWKKQFTITIPEGSYSPTNLCQTLETLMNKKVYNASAVAGRYDFIPGYSQGTDFGSSDISNVILPSSDPNSHWYQNRGKGIKPFAVYYNEVTNKIMFGVNSGEFILHCGKKEEYSLACNVNKHVYDQHVKWGLASYLGFQKKDYFSKITDISGGEYGQVDVGDPYQANEIQGIALPFEGDSPWLTGGATTLDISGTPTSGANDWSSVVGEVKQGNTLYNLPTPVDVSNIIIKNLVSVVDAEYNLNIHGEDALYMEVEKYNNIDEMYPYSQRTNNLYNNDLAHRANGSFARIPLTHLPFGQELGSRNNFVLNVFHTDPPIKKIDRLKFKFRYHDGRLVDFKNLPFSFTLEFNMLKDEQVLGRSVRVPTLYNL